jgi:hypothetical protein
MFSRRQAVCAVAQALWAPDILLLGQGLIGPPLVAGQWQISGPCSLASLGKKGLFVWLWASCMCVGGGERSLSHVAVTRKWQVVKSAVLDAAEVLVGFEPEELLPASKHSQRRCSAVCVCVCVGGHMTCLPQV